MAGVFTDGHVYAAKKVGGMILIEDLGEHADIDTMIDVSTLVLTGRHCLTKKVSKHENEHVRKYVAGNPHTRYKVLVALVQDTNPYVLGKILERKKIPYPQKNTTQCTA